jgi:hypothetical protein
MPAGSATRPATENGFAVSSQNFESAYDAYESVGAQSCSLDSARARIRGIVVIGTYYDGLGPADSMSITFYGDEAGIPGAVLTSQTVSGTAVSNQGAFDLPLAPFTIRRAEHRTFWFSVQANMSFERSGQWGWWATPIAHGVPDQWENPGGGFGLCSTWCPIASLDEHAVSFQAALLAGSARGH